MSNGFVAVACGLLALSAAALAAGGAPEYLRTTRPRLDLDGQWDFRLDPADEGVAGGWSGFARASPAVKARSLWSGADAPYPDRIRVPGNWQAARSERAAGFGEPRRHLRHDYQGKAWYRRTVQIPADWAGKRVWLHLGGVTNTADRSPLRRRCTPTDATWAP
jgi:beta-galactosidase/beta-glucuronidase